MDALNLLCDAQEDARLFAASASSQPEPEQPAAKRQKFTPPSVSTKTHHTRVHNGLRDRAIALGLVQLVESSCHVTEATTLSSNR